MWPKAKITAVLVFTCVHCTALAESETDTTARLQDRWMRCLKESYQVNVKQTPDRNAAAEMAFRACSTEEDELRAWSVELGVPQTYFVQLKSATKRVLIDGK